MSTDWLAVHIELERRLLESRAVGNFYYPDDPRYKGREHQATCLTDTVIVGEMNTAWENLTEEQRHLVDPDWPKEQSVRYAQLFTAAQEQLKKNVDSLVEPLPGRPCAEFGHVRAAEEAGRVRFRCMECLGMLVCDPEDKTTVFFGGKKHPYDVNTQHDKLAEELGVN